MIDSPLPPSPDQHYRAHFLDFFLSGLHCLILCMLVFPAFYFLSIISFSLFYQLDGERRWLTWYSVGRHATVTGSTPRCGKGFFFHSQFQCRLSYGVRYSPRVQLCALTSVRTLKISSTGSRIPLLVLGLTKIPHSLLGTGSAALAAPVALPR